MSPLRASTEAEPRGEGFGKVGAQRDLDKRRLDFVARLSLLYEGSVDDPPVSLASFPSISD